MSKLEICSGYPEQNIFDLKIISTFDVKVGSNEGFHENQLIFVADVVMNAGVMTALLY